MLNEHREVKNPHTAGDGIAAITPSGSSQRSEPRTSPTAIAESALIHLHPAHSRVIHIVMTLVHRS